MNLLFLLFFAYNISYAKPNHQIDSVRIIGHRIPVDYAYNLGKDNFFREIIHETKDSANSYGVIDTIVYCKSSIDSLVLLFDKAQKIGKNPYGADQIILKAKYVRRLRFLAWMDNSLDYRLLFILFKKDKEEFIWLSTSCMERGKDRYKMSEELLNYIERFSNTIVH